MTVPEITVSSQTADSPLALKKQKHSKQKNHNSLPNKTTQMSIKYPYAKHFFASTQFEVLKQKMIIYLQNYFSLSVKNSGKS